MGIIQVNGIRLRAFHGCLPEEGKIGGDYIVDVHIETDFRTAEHSDRLEDTLDYCVVYEIVKAEMAIRSKLVEAVCRRILDKFSHRFPKARFEVKVTKLHPPIPGDVESVAVLLKN